MQNLQVGLMILDEIHLLGADRGPILEVLIHCTFLSCVISCLKDRGFALFYPYLGVFHAFFVMQWVAAWEPCFGQTHFCIIFVQF